MVDQPNHSDHSVVHCFPLLRHDDLTFVERTHQPPPKLVLSTKKNPTNLHPTTTNLSDHSVFTSTDYWTVHLGYQILRLFPLLPVTTNYHHHHSRSQAHPLRLQIRTSRGLYDRPQSTQSIVQHGAIDLSIEGEVTSIASHRISPQLHVRTAPLSTWPICRDMCVQEPPRLPDPARFILPVVSCAESFS